MHTWHPLKDDRDYTGVTFPNVEIAYIGGCLPGAGGRCRRRRPAPSGWAALRRRGGPSTKRAGARGASRGAPPCPAPRPAGRSAANITERCGLPNLKAVQCMGQGMGHAAARKDLLSGYRCFRTIEGPRTERMAYWNLWCAGGQGGAQLVSVGRLGAAGTPRRLPARAVAAPCCSTPQRPAR